MRELKPKELRMVIKTNSFGVKTSKDVKADGYVVIGQEIALRALKVAIGMKDWHDNVYVAGPTRIGKTSLIRLFLENNVVKNESVPPDWCYVYNFNDPLAPIVLSFSAGQGKEFKTALENFIKLFLDSLISSLQSPAYVNKIIAVSANEKLTQEEQDEIIKLYEKCFLELLTQLLNPLKIAYPDEKVQKFLQNVEDFMLNRPAIFLDEELDKEEFGKIFRVNLFVDNSETKYAPIVEAHMPSYYSLFGKIEKVYDGDTYTTDFMLIKPGLIHKANGGYLIVPINELGEETYYIWQTIKEILRQQKFSVAEPSGLYAGLPLSTLQPEAIPLNIKVILVGDYATYEALNEYDEQFGRIFQKKVEFDSQVELREDTKSQYVQYIVVFAKKGGLLPLDKKAIARLLEYGLEIAESAQYLSLKMSFIKEILREANFWAKENKRSVITAEDVEMAIHSKNERSSYFERWEREYIKSGIIKIDVDGQVVGQINALVVYSLSNYEFGAPSRVTAKTFVGKKGLVSIDREAEMSESIFNKATLIISSFFQDRYGQKKSFPYSITICFEQVYSGIGGDSASIAELVAIFSSLAEVGIKQELAVTGSVNQHGEVQAIGGVNTKIVGFYKTCKEKGFTGNQGVIIPEDNVSELMLPQEIVADVKNGVFHIYAIKRIEEAVKLLTGLHIKKIDKKIKEKVDQVQVINKKKKIVTKINNI